MPLVVNKKEVEGKIIEALQECIKEKPLASISMRDVAKHANMSHQKLLYYFKSKDDLICSYVEYAKDFFSSKCIEWFEENDKKKEETNKEYINRFLKYVAEGKEDEHRPNATVQIYVMAQYNEKIAKLINDMFNSWKKVMEKCLVKIYGSKVGVKEAEAMMILISGTFLCNYNKVLSGTINSEIIDNISNLKDE